MKKINGLALKMNVLVLGLLTLLAPSVYAVPTPTAEVNLNFTPPAIGTLISFMVRFLFFFAGLAALLYLLLGALAWVMSSGDKENLKKAQDKIQAAVLGLIIIVVVLVIIVVLEQIVLKGAFCVGISGCSVSEQIPHLLN
jgi:ABC-type Na+ efflux pump permease subunit